MAKQMDMVLHRSNIVEATEKCMTLSVDNRKIVGGKGKSKLGEQTHLVMKCLWKANEHIITKMKLLQDNYGHFDTLDLDRISLTLQNAGLVEEIRRSDNEITYKLTDYGIEMITKLMEG